MKDCKQLPRDQGIAYQRAVLFFIMSNLGQTDVLELDEAPEGYGPEREEYDVLYVNTRPSTRNRRLCSLVLELFRANLWNDATAYP